MSIDFYNSDDVRQFTVTYQDTAGDFVRAYIDMVDAVKSGGWCIVTVGNTSVMVTNLEQLFPNAKEK